MFIDGDIAVLIHTVGLVDGVLAVLSGLIVIVPEPAAEHEPDPTV
jgi:hypothetical protein